MIARPTFDENKKFKKNPSPFLSLAAGFWPRPDGQGQMGLGWGEGGGYGHCLQGVEWGGGGGGGDYRGDKQGGDKVRCDRWGGNQGQQLRRQLGSAKGDRRGGEIFFLSNPGCSITKTTPIRV